MTWVSDLGDVTQVYAQKVMNVLQNDVAGNTPDGRPRNTFPYFAFGKKEFEMLTPPTALPAMIWTQDNGKWSYSRNMGGGFNGGSLGTWQLTYHVKVFGHDRAEAVTEVIYLLQSIFAFDPRPPISDLTTTVDGGAIEQAGKETITVSWSVPILVPIVPPQTASINYVSGSLAINTGSIGQQWSSMSGSIFPTRTVISRGR